MFVCPRCGNKDERYIGYKNGEPYCRKCIIFSGEEAKDYEHPPKKAPLSLAYKLSEEQSNLSRKIVETRLCTLCAGQAKLKSVMVPLLMRFPMVLEQGLPFQEEMLSLSSIGE